MVNSQRRGGAKARKLESTRAARLKDERARLLWQILGLFSEDDFLVQKKGRVEGLEKSLLITNIAEIGKKMGSG